jgi:hypothetical protein
VIGLGISATLDRSQHHQRHQTTEIPWFFVPKIYPLVSSLPASPSIPMIITKTTASLTADKFRDSINGCDSMAGVKSGGFGDRPWY